MPSSLLVTCQAASRFVSLRDRWMKQKMKESRSFCFFPRQRIHPGKLGLENEHEEERFDVNGLNSIML